MIRKCAIFTDPHCGSHGNSETWHKIFLDFGGWMVNDLKRKGINTIIMMGDFFDNRNEIGVQSLSVAGKFMDLLSEFQVVIIAGNHDMFYKSRNDVNSVSIFSGRNNVRVITDICKDTLGDLDVTYLPWGSDLSKLEKSDAIFGHLELNGFYMMPGKVAEGKVDPKLLLSKSDLIFSGHFHLRDERTYSNGKIIYIGSPYQLNWGEISNTPGYYIFDCTDKSYSFVENTISPRHIKMASDKLDINLINSNFVTIEMVGTDDEEENKQIRNTVFAATPLETRFSLESDDITTENITVQYSEGIELEDIIVKFVDDLKLGAQSDSVKDKLKQLYKKHYVSC